MQYAQAPAGDDECDDNDQDATEVILCALLVARDLERQSPVQSRVHQGCHYEGHGVGKLRIDPGPEHSVQGKGTGSAYDSNASEADQLPYNRVFQDTAVPFGS